LIGKRPPELQSDIAGPRSVTILRKFATFILADAQAPQLFSHFVLLVFPRSAHSKAFAARLSYLTEWYFFGSKKRDTVEMAAISIDEAWNQINTLALRFPSIG
jgi:hypothetical protein